MITGRFAQKTQIFSIAIVGALGVYGLLTVDAAAFEISQAQRAACTPDVLRLCSSEMPDTTRVIACMRANKAQVSAGCRAVIPASAWIPSKTKIAER